MLACACEVSIATLNSSGFSMTTVSPAGSPVAVSSNLTVTVITGSPGDNRRLRATDGCGGDISTLTAAAGRAFSTEPSEGNSVRLLAWPGVLAGRRFVQVGGGHGGRVLLGYPDAPDHADRRAAGQVQGPGHVLGRLTHRDVPGLAGDRAAHRIQPGTEAGRALDGDPVVGRAGPVQLPVGQPPDQGPAGEITESGVDLGQADVVAPGQRGAAGQPPAWLPVHERRRDPVREHRAGPGHGARSRHVWPAGRRRRLRGRRGRLRGNRVIASGGASGHPAQPLILAICASDSVMTDGGSGWKCTFASCAVPLVTAQVRNARRSWARVALGWEAFTTAYS